MFETHSGDASTIGGIRNGPIEMFQFAPQLDRPLTGRIGDMTCHVGNEVDVVKNDTRGLRRLRNNFSQSDIGQPGPIEEFLVVLFNDPQGKVGVGKVRVQIGSHVLQKEFQMKGTIAIRNQNGVLLGIRGNVGGIVKGICFGLA